MAGTRCTFMHTTQTNDIIETNIGTETIRTGNIFYTTKITFTTTLGQTNRTDVWSRSLVFS